MLHLALWADVPTEESKSDKHATALLPFLYRIKVLRHGSQPPPPQDSCWPPQPHLPPLLSWAAVAAHNHKYTYTCTHVCTHTLCHHMLGSLPTELPSLSAHCLICEDSVWAKVTSLAKITSPIYPIILSLHLSEKLSFLFVWFSYHWDVS